MNLEDQFKEQLGKWVEFIKGPAIQFSSMATDMMECKEYENLRTMGKEIIPLIRKHYEDFESGGTMAMHALPMLVGGIMGNEFQIPVNIQGRMQAIENYTRNWLNENADKYLSSDE